MADAFWLVLEGSPFMYLKGLSDKVQESDMKSD